MSIKISAMPDAGPITGAELFPFVQGGANVKDFLGSIFLQIGGQIVSDFTIYASPTGNNSNDGLSSLTPKLIDGAIAFFGGKTLADGVTGFVQLADGVYNLTDAISCPYYFGVNGRIRIRGNVTNRNAVIINNIAGYPGQALFQIGSPLTSYTFQNLTLRGTGTNLFAFFTFNAGKLLFGDELEFGAAPSLFAHAYGSNSGKLEIDSLCNAIYMRDNANLHVRADTHSYIDYIVNSSFKIDTLGGTRAFGTFMEMNGLGYAGLYAPGGVIPVVGTINGTKGNFTTNSVAFAFINTPDILLPGSSVVTYASGGQHN